MSLSLSSTYELTTSTDPVQPGSNRLSVADVVRVARYQQNVLEPDSASLEKIQASLAWVEHTVQQITDTQDNNTKPTAYYGINTGFGALAGRTALDSTYLTKALGHNLIASHSVGVGSYFSEDIVRGTLLIRAQSLAQGYSGVRPLVISKLLAMLNERVYPAVPEQGSLGASGDLAPLAHLLLTVCAVPTPDSTEQDLELDTTDGEAFIPLDPAAGIDSAEHLHLTDSPVDDTQQLW
ncbi:MAG: aromatic amino acid lyase, partial [Thiolinea sp.]